MASFLVAILASCLASMNVITGSITGAVVFLVCGLIAWSIKCGWQPGGQYLRKQFLTVQAHWRGMPSGGPRANSDAKSSVTDEKSGTSAARQSWGLSVSGRRTSIDSDSTLKDASTLV
jgi:hypothetical protein